MNSAGNDGTPDGAGSRAPSLRLFCLHYAGGSAAVYRNWPAALAPHCEVVAVELPGHGRRIREPLRTSATALVDLLLAELGEQMRAGPFAMFGHSLGGLLAFELTHELVRRDLPRPAHLFMSAALCPTRTGGSGLHALPDADLIDALADLNGAPAEALAHEELMALMLPIVRADLCVAETWPFVPERTLDVSVSLLGAISDPIAPPAEIDRWREHFTGELDRRSYQGDHFYLHTEDAAVLRHVSAALRRATGL